MLHDVLLLLNIQWPQAEAVHEKKAPSLDIIETPCDRAPPTENFKNSRFFQNSLKILNVYFWGDKVYFGGNKAYSRGFSKILGFGNCSFFVAGGVLGLCGSGGL